MKVIFHDGTVANPINRLITLVVCIEQSIGGGILRVWIPQFY